MAGSVKISRPYPKTTENQRPWLFYLALGIVANLGIWTSALLYLKFKEPTYTSTLTATLPGAGTNTNVSLPNIGEAYYQSSSPYANSASSDPRETYKVIAVSEPVLRTAANLLHTSLESFGEPRIKIVDNTTIMTFEFKGESPEQARTKTLALYQALQLRLIDLRREEITQQNAGSKSALSAAQRKLEIAQNRLSEYKARSGLNSNEQLTKLSDNIEQLRRQRAEILAQQQQAIARQKQLSKSLNLSSQEAVDAFVLQTDQIFQQNLKDYSQTNADLTVLSAKFQPNHPTVVAQQAKQKAAQIALLERSKSLLGRPVSQEILNQISLGNTESDQGREKFFQEMVTVQAEQRGLQAQAQSITLQISQLEDRLKNQAQQEFTLDALKRDLQIAEAVFSSSLTKLDISRSDSLGSYPLIQVLAEPSLAKSPSQPKPTWVFLGAVLGSLFSTTGIVTLWQRQVKRRKKNEF